MKSDDANFKEASLFSLEPETDARPDAKESSGGIDAPPSRALSVLLRALEQNRLPHGILLYADCLDDAMRTAAALAGAILKTDFPEKHADYFCLRPSGKARFIRVDPMRAFIKSLYLSPSQGTKKVGVVLEADRMMEPAANAFLKTLEEPPADTTIILVTERPRDFLPTIRSRCFHFRIPSKEARSGDADWNQWKSDLCAWLDKLARIADGQIKADPAQTVLPVYGLSGRLAALIAQTAQARWDEAKDHCPESMTQEEREALEEGLRKGVRTQLLMGVEQTVRDFAMQSPRPPARNARALTDSVKDIELSRGLLEVNFGENAAIEHFLLRMLRHWTKAAAE